MKPLLPPFAALVLAAGAQAQTTTLGPVTVTGRSDPSADVAGWGDVPLSKSPLQASIVTREQMRERGVQRLSDVVGIDPAVSDAYNAEGYWDSLTVRGFVIDNRSNYRRDGLPINAEASIPLDNKERIEILKGTSGMQAGTSAPGGLVNLVVKRPGNEPIREAQLGWRSANSLLAAVDISQRFGASDAFGIRVNAAAEHLDPRVRDARGERHLLAIAADWRIGADSLLEAEMETSRRRQPSVPGFSMLGGAVPAPVDPRINLNNQPWTLPVVFDGSTASLRFTQQLSPAWRWSVHAASQRLRTDDRIAFPYGCGAEGNFDRYCSDGTFDLYDYRSENERRRSDALEWSLHGVVSTGALTHRATVGVLRSRFQARFQEQAFNFVGTGNVEGTLVTPPDPTLAPGSADRDEDSTELFARDAVPLGATTTAWLGLRHTRLARGYTQSFTTPWLAISHEFATATTAYASWGQGIESVLTPCLPTYGSAACQPLPAQRSRQAEIGLKRSTTTTSWTLAWFDIEQPATTDTGTAYETKMTSDLNGAPQPAIWGNDLTAFSTYHFQIKSDGTSQRGTTTTHWQGVAVLAPYSPNPGGPGDLTP